MKRLLILLIATVALMGATPANAATRDSVPWTAAPCVEPVLVDVNWDRSGGVLVLSGGATQCGPTVANGGFRIATYTEGGTAGVAPGYNVRLFADKNAGTFRSFGAAAVPSAPGRYGVCVLGADQRRELCAVATVTTGPSGSPPRALLQPLAADDPLVAKRVFTTPYTGLVAPPPPREQPNRNCGTCF